MAPLRSRITGLFKQLTLCSLLDWLPGIDFPCWQFQKNPPEGITELTLKKELPVVQKCQYHHRPRMDYVLANGLTSIWQSDDVFTHMEQGAIEHRLRGN